MSQDECSFVSLRDVERTMLVFEYFYGQIDDFRNAATRQQHADDEPEVHLYNVGRYVTLLFSMV